MTEHDLTTLLRDHVSDEPPFVHTSAAVLSRGRRRLRRTRVAVASGGVALALAAGMGVSQWLDDETGPDRVVDPAIAEALDAYNVTTMPRTMDEHARSVLEGSVPDLGPADFVAFDDQRQRLPERYWEKASGLIVRYGLDSPHQISVTLNHSRSSAEGDAGRFCEVGVEAGWYVDCSVERTRDGDVAITTLGAMRLDRPRGDGLQSWSAQFMAVAEDEIESVPADRLWFAQDVKVIKSETFVTYASEIVQAPDLTTARERLLVPPDDLVAIGLDPALVMPKPPPGENGCPQWTMPTMQVSCTG